MFVSDPPVNHANDKSAAGMHIQVIICFSEDCCMDTALVKILKTA